MEHDAIIETDSENLEELEDEDTQDTDIQVTQGEESTACLVRRKIEEYMERRQFIDDQGLYDDFEEFDFALD